MREIEFRGRCNLVNGFMWNYGRLNTANTKPSIIGYKGSETLVEPETVGEWTGLYDKHFRRIYEGDVVSVVPVLGLVFKGVVIFNTHTAAFEIFREELGDTGPLNDDFSIKVLGNIFDDSEFKEKYWKHWDRRYYE